MDWVVIDDRPTAEALLATLRPDFYLKGCEYEQNRASEQERRSEGEKSESQVDGVASSRKDPARHELAGMLAVDRKPP